MHNACHVQPKWSAQHQAPSLHMQAMALAAEAPASTSEGTARTVQGSSQGPTVSAATSQPPAVDIANEVRSRTGAMLAGMQAGAQAVFDST